jgi:serine/threonine-protein kinase HipA
MGKDSKWKLSPAYDVTYAYDPTSLWLAQHQLSINGKRKDITLDDILTIAKEISLKKGKDIVNEIAGGVSRWKEFADEAGIPAKQMQEIGRLHGIGMTYV